MNHQPKGSMCANCKHKDQNCKHLAFEYMPKMVTTVVDGEETTIVRCTEFKRGEK
jgi:hypothetical protein